MITEELARANQARRRVGTQIKVTTAPKLLTADDLRKYTTPELERMNFLIEAELSDRHEESHDLPS